MKTTASIFAIWIGVLLILAAVRGHSQSVPLVASLTFVDADSACPTWPTATSYTLTQAPTPAASLQIFDNGILWTAGQDYSLNGATVTLLNGQQFAAGDVVTCKYRTVIIQ